MENVIDLANVSKRIGPREILKNVTLNVQTGDIFGYLGPNGAGKTTTIRVILGLMKANSGRASVLGQDVQVDRVRRNIGFVLEADGLYDNLTAIDNLKYYGKLYEIPHLNERIEWTIKLVGLASRAGDKIGTFSKGMRQRLALARAMIHAPDVLVLDEPTSGVDPSGQIEIRQLMLDMVRKEGKTILLSSHNLDEVQRICNRIALIHRGRIRLSGELGKLQHEMSHGGVTLETSEPISAVIMAEVQSIPGVQVREQSEKILSLTLSGKADVPGLVTLLATRGVRIEQVRKQEASLEEIYTTILKEAEGQK
jgi:ABC-2 type transport system ATP-binding protein